MDLSRSLASQSPLVAIYKRERVSPNLDDGTWLCQLEPIQRFTGFINKVHIDGNNRVSPFHVLSVSGQRRNRDTDSSFLSSSNLGCLSDAPTSRMKNYFGSAVGVLL
jgi:hypothetical protein